MTRDQPLAFGMGEGSPLAGVYDLDGRVLLLGVGYNNNTSMHLAEYRADYPTKTVEPEGAPVAVDGCRQWVVFDELDLVTDDFERIGRDFEAGAPAGAVDQRAGGVERKDARDLFRIVEWKIQPRPDAQLQNAAFCVRDDFLPLPARQPCASWRQQCR